MLFIYKTLLDLNSIWGTKTRPFEVKAGTENVTEGRDFQCLNDLRSPLGHGKQDGKCQESAQVASALPVVKRT